VSSPRLAATPLVVGSVAVLLACLYVIYQLTPVSWDPTFFTAFGEESTEIRLYAEERLGPVYLRPGLGHDGRFFFVQANDPWVRFPDDNAAVLDMPLYRSQRMLYPMIASGFGILGPLAIVWALLALNLVAIGIGTWAIAWISVEMGISAWWGMAFALNIGFISELNIDGAGVVAAAAAFAALLMLMRERFSWAVASLLVAALSREVMLVVAAGCAWWLWRQGGERLRAATMVVIPAMAVGIWALYIRIRIGWGGGGSGAEALDLPFRGFVTAISSWVKNPADLFIGIALMAVLLAFVVRAIRFPTLLGWGFIGMAFVALFLSEQVWRHQFDFTRAVAPVLTAYVITIVAAKVDIGARHAS
jgi:hypothetical protein